MDFSLTVGTVQDVPLVRVSGAVDLESAPRVTEELVRLAQDPDVRAVVVDLTDVWFFDSSGLSALDEGRSAASEQNTTVGLVCQDPRILRLFDITGLADRFVISATAQQAVRR